MPRSAVFALATLSLIQSAFAQSTAFTYQGELRQGGNPASGTFDLRFTLFSASNGGMALAPSVCADNTQVTNGAFTATLDFGRAFVTTGSRFIQIEVRADTGLGCNDTTGFATLSPRSRATPAPSAIYAHVASGLTPPDGTGINAVSVDSSGAIGIGTQVPTHSVHIARPAPTLALQDTDSTTQQVGYISYRDSANIERAWIGFGSPGDPDLSIINARPGGDIVLNTLGGGNVGIGTSSPTATLDVAGTLAATNIGSQSISTNSVFSARTVPGASIIGVQSVEGSTAILGQISVGSLTAATAVMGNSGCSSANCFGVFSNGRLGATGTKSFRIDHPDAPSTHYLLHYSTEGPEAINFYRGTVTLDDAGRAVVMLPSYFAKINTDPSYQLTAIGAPMPALHVSAKISDDALRIGALAGPDVAAPACWFRIDGGAPLGEVSWRVEAARHDEFVRRNGAPVEVPKPSHEVGTTQD